MRSAVAVAVAVGSAAVFAGACGGSSKAPSASGTTAPAATAGPTTTVVQGPPAAASYRGTSGTALTWEASFGQPASASVTDAPKVDGCPLDDALVVRVDEQFRNASTTDMDEVGWASSVAGDAYDASVVFRVGGAPPVCSKTGDISGKEPSLLAGSSFGETVWVIYQGAAKDSPTGDDAKLGTTKFIPPSVGVGSDVLKLDAIAGGRMVRCSDGDRGSVIPAGAIPSACTVVGGALPA